VIAQRPALARTALALCGGLVLVSATAAPAAAQDADFLFRRPSITAGVRVGYAIPRAGSEIFDFTREQLTVDRSDFNAFAVGGEIAFRTMDRFDVAVGLGFERSSTRSEFREWEGTDGLPIEQDTRFQRVPLTVGVKAYPLERGRRISRFAWIPRRWSPYVAAGGGVMWYRFEQIGEFVDFETLDIFRDDFESKGAAPLGYAGAGVDLALGRRWLVNGEARYSWASAGMDRDFVGFDNIDLSGLRVLVGFSVQL